MYEITSRENRFCNGAAWGLFSLSVYIKVYTYKKCYKEVMDLLRGVNSHWLKEVKSYQSVTFLLRVARKLRFTLHIIYKYSYIMHSRDHEWIRSVIMVILKVQVCPQKSHEAYWMTLLVIYILQYHINLFRGEIWRYAKEVTSLLVFKLNYPPSPSATE